MRLVELTWRDTYSGGIPGKTWHDRDEVKHWGEGGITVRTVGYVVAEDKVSITIASTVQEAHAFAGLWNIPKGCISKRRNLR